MRAVIRLTIQAHPTTQDMESMQPVGRLSTSPGRLPAGPAAQPAPTGTRGFIEELLSGGLVMKRSLILGLVHGAAILGVVVLGIAIAWATDIPTVDKDGAVYLRVTSGGSVAVGSASTSPLVAATGRNYVTV